MAGTRIDLVRVDDNDVNDFLKTQTNAQTVTCACLFSAVAIFFLLTCCVHVSVTSVTSILRFVFSSDRQSSADGFRCRGERICDRRVTTLLGGHRLHWRRRSTGPWCGLRRLRHRCRLIAESQFGWKTDASKTLRLKTVQSVQRFKLQ
jgi:hypothetical protein